jgi:hypothetical protein
VLAINSQELWGLSNLERDRLISALNNNDHGQSMALSMNLCLPGFSISEYAFVSFEITIYNRTLEETNTADSDQR